MNLNKGCIEIGLQVFAYQMDVPMNLNKGCIEICSGLLHGGVVRQDEP